jgi:hypothetical protein
MPDVSNTLLTNSVIAARMLANLFPNTVMLNRVWRDYSSEFQRGRGATVTIRKPATFTVDEFAGTGITVQDTTETQVAVTLDKHLDVSFAVTAQDKTLNVVDFEAQFIQPAAAALAQKIDNLIMARYIDFYATVGTASATPDGVDDITNCGELLNTANVPLDNRSMVLGPKATNKMQQLAGFTYANNVGDQGQTLRTGQLGMKLGFDFELSQNVKTHTAGTLTHNVTAGKGFVNGAVAAGAATMAVDNNGSSTLTGTLLPGDLFTVAGVTGTYVVTGTATLTAAANAIAAVPFAPVAPTGGFADNAEITVIQTHKANLAFHNTAIAFVNRPLAIPDGLAPNQVSVLNMGGVGLRVVTDYDRTLKQDVISIDCLCGVKTLDAARGVRLIGSTT